MVFLHSCLFVLKSFTTDVKRVPETRVNHTAQIFKADNNFDLSVINGASAALKQVQV